MSADLPKPDYATPNMRLVGHSDQNGFCDGVQVMVHRGYAYVGHIFSKGFSVIDVRDPSKPTYVKHIPAPPNTWTLHLQTAEAEDGQKALAACTFLMPDAILLDWNMPVMDGFEFLRELRKMPGGTKPKVVFCTTENDVAHIARAMHAGADEYIMKPFDKQIVQSKLEEIGLV